MKSKPCSLCGKTLELSFFGKKKKNKDGLQYACRPCTAAQAKKYPSNTREKRREVEARYRANHPGRRAQIVAKSRRKNPEKTRQQTKISNLKRKSNLLWRISSSLRKRLMMAIKRNQKTGSAVSDLGCSIQHFKLYIQSKFQPGMTWENWSRHGWHLDHIRPLSSFDLTNREELMKAVHYTNLQPLWALDNLKKGNKNAA